MAGYAGELGDVDADAFAEELEKRHGFLARFEAIDTTTLSPDEQMDLRVATIDLETSLRRAEDLTIWRRAPYWYLEQLGTAFSSVIQSQVGGSSYDEQGRNLLARLHQTTAYLETAQVNLTTETPPLYAEMGLTAAKGLRAFLSETVSAFAETCSPLLAGDIDGATKQALLALDDFETYLQELTGRAVGSFACGSEHFDFLLQRFHLLDYDHRTLHEFGLEQMTQDKANLEAYARQLDVHTSWFDQIEKVKDDHPQTQQLLEVYRAETERARAHCVAQELITLPAGEEVQVRWLPAYLRAGAPLGLMHTTPPFAIGLESHLLLTPVDPAAEPATQTQHLRDHCYAFARSIALHELYPGHHTQKVHHKLATAHTPMRRYFSSPVFVEGWGLYTEELMAETEFMVEPAVQLFKLRNALWRSARVVVDSGLHTRNLSFEDAVVLMCDEVHLDRRMAAGEVRRYTTHNNPTYPSAYLLGKTAILELRSIWQRRQGDGFTLKAFHDHLLGFGSPPVKLIAKQMLAS